MKEIRQSRRKSIIRNLDKEQIDLNSNEIEDIKILIPIYYRYSI